MDKKMEKEIKAIVEGSDSKSKKMVALYNLGLELKDIAKLMDVRYNFVYNVVSNHCRMNELVLRTNTRGASKKDEIIALLDAGKSNVEIAKELKSNYNYVSKVVKEHLRAAM